MRTNILSIAVGLGLIALVATGAAAVDCGTAIYVWDPVAYFPANSAALELTVVDLNGDGKPDLVARFQSEVRVAIGDGSTFGTVQTIYSAAGSGSGFIASIAVGDFTSDGKPDIAIVGDETLKLLQGSGNGTFAAATSMAIGSWARLLAGDFDADGKLDLAGVDDTKAAFLLRGNGAGGFTQSWRRSASTYLLAPVKGDFDGDGKLDLAYTPNTVDGVLMVEFGDGVGGFEHQERATPGRPGNLVAADFNGDGRDDVVVLSTSANINVHLGATSRTLAAPVTYAACSAGLTGSVAKVGDVTGDGIPDIVEITTASYSSAIQIWSGSGNGTFSARCFPLAGSASGMTVSDFDSDGTADIFVGMPVAPYYSNLYRSRDVCGKATMTFDGGDPMPVAGHDLELFVDVQEPKNGMTQPTGDVTIKEGDNVLGTFPLNASGAAYPTVTGVAVGSHHYTASYGGDGSYYTAEATLDVTVAATESTLTIDGPAESTYGQDPTISAVLNGGGQPSDLGFEYSIDGGTWKSSSTIFGADAGPHTITARYKGSRTTPPGTSAPFSHTILKATPTLTVTPPSTTIMTGVMAATTVSWSTSLNGSGAASPTGTLSLMRGTTVLATKSTTSNTMLSTTLAPGAVYDGFFVAYGGDKNFAAVQSPPTSIAVLYNGPATFKANYAAGHVSFNYVVPSVVTSMHFYRQSNRSAATTEVAASGEALVAGDVYLYWYTAHTANGTTYATSAKELVVAVPFTDETLAAGDVVKAVHFQDILDATNVFRGAIALSPISLETLAAGTTIIKAEHLKTLRDAINQGRAVLGVPSYTFTDVPLGTARPVRLRHMLELRDALR